MTIRFGKDIRSEYESSSPWWRGTINIFLCIVFFVRLTSYFLASTSTRPRALSFVPTAFRLNTLPQPPPPPHTHSICLRFCNALDDFILFFYFETYHHATLKFLLSWSPKPVPDLEDLESFLFLWFEFFVLQKRLTMPRFATSFPLLASSRLHFLFLR